MEKILGNNGTLTTAMTKITTEFDLNNADSMAKKIDGATAGTKLDFKDAYKKFEDAIKGATDIIDEALKSNDLTELDTTNLKALRSYITETKATFDAAAKDAGLSTTAENAADKVTDDSLAKLRAGLNSAAELGKTATEKSTATHTFSQQQPERATSSKLAMKELLDVDGTGGTVGAELKNIKDAITGTGGIKSIIEGVANGNGTQPVALNVSAKYTDLKTAIKKTTDAIDEKLDSGDLTQLDTSNLKALKSSINDIQSQLESTFADLGLQAGASNANVTPAKAKELQEAFKAVETSNTELGEKAVGVATSSQNQAETIADIKES